MACTIGAISDFCVIEAGVGAYGFVLVIEGVRLNECGAGWRSAQGPGAEQALAYGSQYAAD